MPENLRRFQNPSGYRPHSPPDGPVLFDSVSNPVVMGAVSAIREPSTPALIGLCLAGVAARSRQHQHWRHRKIGTRLDSAKDLRKIGTVLVPTGSLLV